MNMAVDRHPLRVDDLANTQITVKANVIIPVYGTCKHVMRGSFTLTDVVGDVIENQSALSKEA